MQQSPDGAARVLIRALDTAASLATFAERGRLTSTATVYNDPAYAGFAMPAAVLLLVAVGLRAIPFFGDLT